MSPRARQTSRTIPRTGGGVGVRSKPSRAVATARTMADCAVVRELRVLLTHTYCWPEVRRGAERYIHELGAALVDAGHEVQIIATAPHAAKGSVLDVPVQRLRRRDGPARYQEFGP